MDAGKGKRNPNFTYTETNCLLELVGKYKHIIECKKTDSGAKFEREKVWKKIEAEFNNSCGDVFRDSKVLKSKYDNVKKSTKRKVCEEKKYTGGTGGGAGKSADLTDVDNRVLELLNDEMVQGLQSRFDHDAADTVPGAASNDEEEDDDATVLEVEAVQQSESVVIDESVPVVIDLDPTWRNYTPEHLRQPRSIPLLPRSCRPPPASQPELQSKAGCPSDKQPGSTSRAAIPSYIDKRAELHKTRPYRRVPEKETWDNVGKVKMELLELQKQIAVEELRQKKRQDERLEEEHRLKMQHMQELHEIRKKILVAEIGLDEEDLNH